MKTYNFCYETGSLPDIIDFALFTNEKNVLVQIFCGQGKEVLQYVNDILLTNIAHAIVLERQPMGKFMANLSQHSEPSFLLVFLNIHTLKQPMRMMKIPFNVDLTLPLI